VEADRTVEQTPLAWFIRTTDCALIIISGLILTGTYLEERVMIRTVLTLKKKLKLKKLVTGATSPLKHKKKSHYRVFFRRTQQSY